MPLPLPPGLSSYGSPTRHYTFQIEDLLRAPNWRRHWRIDGPWPSTYGASTGQQSNPRFPTLDFDLTTTTWVDPIDDHGFTAMLSVIMVPMFDDACHLCMSLIPHHDLPERVSMDGRLFCSDACSGLAAEIELMQRLDDRDYLTRSFGTEVQL